MMTALCAFFPGADTPIDYNDCEDDDAEYSDEDYMMYDTQDSLETETDNMSQTQNSVRYTDETASDPIPYRNTNRPAVSPRPRSLVETQVNKLQNLIASEGHPQSKGNTLNESDQARIGAVKIPQQFKKNEGFEVGRSPITINRTSSSPVPSEKTYMPSGGSTPQDTLRIVRSPAIFSESSSPRRLSPIVNYNIGNMNPRHIDIEQYWNRESEKSARSGSTTSNTNSSRKEDCNQNYCDRLSAANSPMSTRELNGNTQRPVDARYQSPLQIEVDPVSKPLVMFFFKQKKEVV